MTTAELTTEIEGLTATERERLGIFIANMKSNRKVHQARKRFTKKEFISAIKKSHGQAENGKLKPAYQSLREIGRKYGL